MSTTSPAKCKDPKLTCRPWSAEWPCRFSFRMRFQNLCHNAVTGNPSRWAGLRTYIFFAGPDSMSQPTSNSVIILAVFLTLYPAAYPRPGKREKNLRATGADALSLKMTWFSSEAFAICASVRRNYHSQFFNMTTVPVSGCSSTALQSCRPFFALATFVCRPNG